MEITINNKQYKLKYTLRAMMLFEQITKKIFSIESLSDELVFFYSIILANNPDEPMNFDQFLDAIDNDPNLLVQFQNFLIEENNKRNTYTEDSVKSDDFKKKS